MDKYSKACGKSGYKPRENHRNIFKDLSPVVDMSHLEICSWVPIENLSLWATSPMEQRSSWSLHTFIFSFSCFLFLNFSFYLLSLYPSLYCLVCDKQFCKKVTFVTFLQTVLLHLDLTTWMNCSDNFCQCMLPSVLNFGLYESVYWQLAHLVKVSSQ